MKSAYAYSALLGAAALAIAACSEGAVTAPRDASPGASTNRIAPMERPINEFLLAQGAPGTGANVPAEMMPGAIAWIDWNTGLTAVVDYAGAIYRREAKAVALDPDAKTVGDAAASVNAPPSFSGRIIEQILFDGTARVIVDVQATGALSFAVHGFAPRYDELAFGARSYGEADAVRGSSRLVLVYRAPGPGMPFPTVSDLLYMPQPGFRFEYLSFSSSATPLVYSKLNYGTLSVDQPGIRAGDPYMGAIGSLPAVRVSID
jgi:hypothetical protein